MAATQVTAIFKFILSLSNYLVPGGAIDSS